MSGGRAGAWRGDGSASCMLVRVLASSRGAGALQRFFAFACLASVACLPASPVRDCWLAALAVPRINRVEVLYACSCLDTRFEALAGCVKKRSGFHNSGALLGFRERGSLDGSASWCGVTAISAMRSFALSTEQLAVVIGFISMSMLHCLMRRRSHVYLRPS